MNVAELLARIRAALDAPAGPGTPASSAASATSVSQPTLPTATIRPIVPGDDLVATFIDAAIRNGAEVVAELPDAAALGEHYVAHATTAVALSGAVVIDSGDALQTMWNPTLVVHVDAATIVATLADALAYLATRPLPATRVFISGPSKTADIEGILITGVHGPGRVVVRVSSASAPRSP